MYKGKKVRINARKTLRRQVRSNIICITPSISMKLTIHLMVFESLLFIVSPVIPSRSLAHSRLFQDYPIDLLWSEIEINSPIFSAVWAVFVLVSLVSSLICIYDKRDLCATLNSQIIKMANDENGIGFVCSAHRIELYFFVFRAKWRVWVLCVYREFFSLSCS